MPPSPTTMTHKIRIYYMDKPMEEVSMSADKFTEKYVNKKLNGYFNAHDGPDDTRIFVSQDENDIIDETRPENKEATKVWRQAGYKDALYGTVLQVPEKLAVIFFSKMQIVMAM